MYAFWNYQAFKTFSLFRGLRYKLYPNAPHGLGYDEMPEARAGPSILTINDYEIATDLSMGYTYRFNRSQLI